MSSAVKLHTKLHTDMYMIHNTPHLDTPLKPFPHSSHLNGFYQANGCKTNEDYAYRGWSHLCSLVNILRTDDLFKAFPHTSQTYGFPVNVLFHVLKTGKSFTFNSLLLLLAILQNTKRSYRSAHPNNSARSDE